MKSKFIKGVLASLFAITSAQAAVYIEIVINADYRDPEYWVIMDRYMRPYIQGNRFAVQARGDMNADGYCIAKFQGANKEHKDPNFINWWQMRACRAGYNQGQEFAETYGRQNGRADGYYAGMRWGIRKFAFDVNSNIDPAQAWSAMRDSRESYLNDKIQDEADRAGSQGQAAGAKAGFQDAIARYENAVGKGTPDLTPRVPNLSFNGPARPFESLTPGIPSVQEVLERKLDKWDWLSFSYDPWNNYCRDYNYYWTVGWQKADCKFNSYWDLIRPEYRWDPNSWFEIRDALSTFKTWEWYTASTVEWENPNGQVVQLPYHQLNERYQTAIERRAAKGVTLAAGNMEAIFDTAFLEGYKRYVVFPYWQAYLRHESVGFEIGKIIGQDIKQKRSFEYAVGREFDRRYSMLTQSAFSSQIGGAYSSEFSRVTGFLGSNCVMTRATGLDIGDANNNGVIERGENITASFALRNIGGKACTNVDLDFEGRISGSSVDLKQLVDKIVQPVAALSEQRVVIADVARVGDAVPIKTEVDFIATLTNPDPVGSFNFGQKIEARRKEQVLNTLSLNGINVATKHVAGQVDISYTLQNVSSRDLEAGIVTLDFYVAGAKKHTVTIDLSQNELGAGDVYKASTGDLSMDPLKLINGTVDVRVEASLSGVRLEDQKSRSMALSDAGPSLVNYFDELMRGVSNAQWQNEKRIVEVTALVVAANSANTKHIASTEQYNPYKDDEINSIAEHVVDNYKKCDATVQTDYQRRIGQTFWDHRNNLKKNLFGGVGAGKRAPYRKIVQPLCPTCKGN